MVNQLTKKISRHKKKEAQNWRDTVYSRHRRTLRKRRTSRAARRIEVKDGIVVSADSGGKFLGSESYGRRKSKERKRERKEEESDEGRETNEGISGECYGRREAKRGWDARHTTSLLWNFRP